MAKAGISNTMKKQLQPFEEKVEVLNESYVVAFNSNNQAFNNQAVFSSEARAREYMNETIALQPEMSDALHVIPAFEMRESA